MPRSIELSVVHPYLYEVFGNGYISPSDVPRLLRRFDLAALVCASIVSGSPHPAGRQQTQQRQRIQQRRLPAIIRPNQRVKGREVQLRMLHGTKGSMLTFFINAMATCDSARQPSALSHAGAFRGSSCYGLPTPAHRHASLPKRHR